MHAALESMGRACDSLEYSNSHILQEYGVVFLESDAENYFKKSLIEEAWCRGSHTLTSSDRLLEGFRQASVGMLDKHAC
jgi:hypothetical protein